MRSIAMRLSVDEEVHRFVQQFDGKHEALAAMTRHTVTPFCMRYATSPRRPSRLASTLEVPLANTDWLFCTRPDVP
jgi:hypothetical protein